MSNDPGQREARGRRPDHRLPRILRVSTTRAAFDPPPRRNFDSALAPVPDTVEFLIETDGPIPVRALSPVLYVGDTPVTEVSADDDRHYRFVALRPASLRDGAPLVLGWSGQTPGTALASDDAAAESDAQETFRFEAPDGFGGG